MTTSPLRPDTTEEKSLDTLTALHGELFARLDLRLGTYGQARGRAGSGRHVNELGTNRDLYRLTMAKLFHYTSHNSPIRPWRVSGPNLQKTASLHFVYQHAKEEPASANDPGPFRSAVFFSLKSRWPTPCLLSTR